MTEIGKYMKEPEIYIRLAQEAVKLSNAALDIPKRGKHGKQFDLVENLMEAAAAVSVCLEALEIDTDDEPMRTRKMKLIIKWISSLESVSDKPMIKECRPQ